MRDKRDGGVVIQNIYTDHNFSLLRTHTLSLSSLCVNEILSLQAHIARSEGQGNWSKLCPEIGVLQQGQRCVFSVAD